jgi:hypothetical protein
MVQYPDIIKEENRVLIIMQEENAENDYETVHPSFYELVERNGEPVRGVAQTRDFK